MCSLVNSSSFYFCILTLIIIAQWAEAVPINSSTIDFDKRNRQGDLPIFPFEEDLRRSTSHISQAHEVLRLALSEFLDLKDANLTFYLGRMRSKKEPYLDELGKVITGYRTIFSLISEQVDEVSNNNYAANYFDKDAHSLCSVVRYLSNQPTFSTSRETLRKKMSDAIGKECNPCVHYKVPKYADDEGSDTPNIAQLETDHQCDERKQQSIQKPNQNVSYASYPPIPASGSSIVLSQEQKDATVNQIIQGHKIIRLALHELLDWKDRSSDKLSDYLDAFVAQEMPYLDDLRARIREFDSKMTKLKNQIELLLLNVTIANYNESHYSMDAHVLCIFAHYLSNQDKIQGITKKMEDVLHKECDVTDEFITITTPSPMNSNDQYFIGLKEKLCGRQSILVRIRNVRTREFLYASDIIYNINNKRRRRAFTWRDLDDLPPYQSNRSAWISGKEIWELRPIASRECNNNNNNNAPFVNIRIVSLAHQKHVSNTSLYVDSSDHQLYLSNLDEYHEKYHSAGEWQLIAESTEEGLLRADFCLLNDNYDDIKRFVLRNAKYGAEFLNGDYDNFFTYKFSTIRRNVMLSNELSVWEILPVKRKRGQ